MKFYIPKTWFMKKAPLEEGCEIGVGPNPDYVPRPIRQSIKPTYDHRKTGDRFTVSSSINDVTICDHKNITDPFVRHTIRIHWWDAIKAIINRGHIAVQVTVDGDHDIFEDVMELNAEYLGQRSTRRQEWDSLIEKSLSEYPDEK